MTISFAFSARSSLDFSCRARSLPEKRQSLRGTEELHAGARVLGEARLDRAEQTAELNALYDQMWVYYNLFQPVLHLREKIATGTRITRRWDKAQTPLLDSWPQKCCRRRRGKRRSLGQKQRIRVCSGKASMQGCERCWRWNSQWVDWRGQREVGDNPKGGGWWTCGQVRLVRRVIPKRIVWT